MPAARNLAASSALLGWLVLLLLLSLPPAPAFSSISVEDLQSVATASKIMVAQVCVAEGSENAAGIVFEEPELPGQGEGALVPETDEGGGRRNESDREIESELPRVAIIIDDMGYHAQMGAALLALEMNLTFSFLPHAPFSREQGELARQRGHEIMVHMPMEARDSRMDPGPGTLYLADPVAELSRKVAQNLASVPHAVGINNHMGSRFTEDRAAMQRFFKLLAGQNFLFVDSGTGSASVAMETAKAMGFRAARRQVFLDNVQTRESVCRQLTLLVKEAHQRGSAIGIAHPNEATLAALTGCGASLLGQVRLVGVSELVR